MQKIEYGDVCLVIQGRYGFASEMEGCLVTRSFADKEDVQPYEMNLLTDIDGHVESFYSDEVVVMFSSKLIRKLYES